MRMLSQGQLGNSRLPRAWVNPYLGPRSLEALVRGLSTEAPATVGSKDGSGVTHPSVRWVRRRGAFEQPLCSCLFERSLLCLLE
jgi:hypothetical protein